MKFGQTWFTGADSIEVWLDIESLDPNSEKMEGIYKTNNFINDIAFGTSLFVFFDLNTYFQF